MEGIMPNSRGAYMAKATVASGGTTNVTFTPPFSCNTWQLRFLVTASASNISLAVQTKDEDGDLVHVDDSPFIQAELGTGDVLELTVDSSNPAIKVTCSGSGSEATIKCKAYRSLDDATSGGYSTELGIS